MEKGISYFETHCHLDFPNYNKDRDEVIRRSIAAGLKYFINVGIDTKTNHKSIELAERYPELYASIGYHPNYADDFNADVLKELQNHPKVVAIGEIGLDYYRKHTSRKLQQKVFIKQLEIAQETGLPVIIHNREADDDCWHILSQFPLKKVVFHCFAGDLALANKIWRKGWYTSFTATITYNNSRMNNIVAVSPLDKIMSETDSPFLAPQHIRGKRNDPTSVISVVKRISELKNLPLELVGEALFNNGCEFFLKKA